MGLEDLSERTKLAIEQTKALGYNPIGVYRGIKFDGFVFATKKESERNMMAFDTPLYSYSKKEIEEQRAENRVIYFKDSICR